MEFMHTIEITISMIMAIIGFIATTVAYAIKYFKAKGNFELKDVLIDLIQEAEKLIKKTGEEKKEYVMYKIEQYAKENKLAYNAEQLSDIVDKIVALSKLINVQ